MTSLVLTVLVLILAYLLQQGHPFLAGVIAVAPIKIIATSFMTLEEGGLERLHHAMSGMLIGQVAWAIVLLVLWLAIKPS
jgi:uncharacterized membrane protein (GlpM family)